MRWFWLLILFGCGNAAGIDAFMKNEIVLIEKNEVGLSYLTEHISDNVDVVNGKIVIRRGGTYNHWLTLSMRAVNTFAFALNPPYGCVHVNGVADTNLVPWRRELQAASGNVSHIGKLELAAGDTVVPFIAADTTGQILIESAILMLDKI